MSEPAADSARDQKHPAPAGAPDHSRLGHSADTRWDRTTNSLFDYMADCRRLVLEELPRFIPAQKKGGGAKLYDMIYEYPLREAKALRPALCIAACRAAGGNLASVLPSAAVLELYHNAFLVHDDVEDGSERRRSGPTLHRVHGVPIAVNVGDAMLALALGPLLENTRVLTLGKALRIFECVALMARESAEGQALELEMIRDQSWSLTDREYFRLVHKKTSHYSFIAPAKIGAIAANASNSQVAAMARFATWMGVAFQIQDDLLNLAGNEAKVGKEIDGDLWEGKHTLILAHALRSATSAERSVAASILAKARPPLETDDSLDLALSLLTQLAQSGDVSERGARQLGEVLRNQRAPQKILEDVAFLKQLIRQYRSLDYARSRANRFAKGARKTLDGMKWLHHSVHRDFLFQLTDFVVQRDN